MGRLLLIKDRKQNTCVSGERMLQGEETEAEPGRSKYRQRGGCGWNRMPGGRVIRGEVYHYDPGRTCGHSHKITENLMREYL